VTAATGLLSLPQLMGLGFAMLVVMAAASWAVLRQDNEAKELRSRIDTVATPYARANALTETAVRAGPTDTGRLVALVSKFFGYNALRRDQYPAKAPVVVFLTLVLAGLLGHILALWLGEIVRFATPVIWIALCRYAFSYFEKRHANVLYGQFPDALGMIVRAVRVGIPVPEAVRNVAREALEPTASEFALLSDQLSIGVPLDEALREVALRNQLQEYRFFATALSLQAQTGGGLSETLENLADVIRKRVGARKRAYALASEARTSTYVLAGLPLVTAGALALISPGYLDVLFTTPLGNNILGAAVALLCIGMFAMRTTISKTLQ